MRVSAAGIAEREGRYLVALRKPGTSIGESWEFPGGKVKRNETPREALIREFREELSVEIVVDELLCTGSFQNRGTTYSLEGYRVRVLSDAFVLSEHTRVKWMSLRDLQHLPMAESDKILLRCIERAVAEAGR
jgi:8-oxo-dGTP diphosphatase